MHYLIVKLPYLDTTGCTLKEKAAKIKPITEIVRRQYSIPSYCARMNPGDVEVVDNLPGEDLYVALSELTEWGRTHTSPQGPNSPHDLLINAVEALEAYEACERQS